MRKSIRLNVSVAAVFLLTAAAAVGVSLPALAADMLVKAPRNAAVTQSGGFYFWADGLYERVKLPTYGLGFRNAAFPAPFVDLGPMQTYNPRLNGGGVRAAIGYGIPGTGTRFEFGGSYVDASTTQSQSTSPNSVILLGQLLSSDVFGGYACVSGVATCTAGGTLNSDYRAWQFNGKAETDWRYGSVVVTPSLTVFGGNSRANQALSQSVQQFVAGLLFNAATYSASTQLEWRDLGARAGLHLNTFVTPALSIGVGGSVAAAARRTSLTGNDAATFTLPAPQPPSAASSSLSLDGNKTVLLANAEANFTYRFSPTTSVHGFAGLNYDGDVPAIAGPSFGSVPGPTSRSPARLIYSSETSYYAGGGLVVNFGP